MAYIASISYGKDSLACLGAIEELGWPLDRIVHAEVWATDTIPADLPPMVEFKAKADEIILARYGIKVEHRRASVTYQEQFYKHSKCNEKRCESFEAAIYGFPMIFKGAWCNSRLKIPPLNNGIKNAIRYIGIAADEPSRHKILNDFKRSPLVEAGWTESMCREWCEQNDLLSPTYTTAARGGCWFCHNQGVDQLRLLRRNYPEYWELLLKWDADSPVSFKPDGHTVHDYDRRFRWEDEGVIDPNDTRFRWAWLDNGVQLKINL